MTAEEAKKRLAEGNQRYVSGTHSTKELNESRRMDLFQNGQHPFALVVCCSDSRMPPELLFDAGLGELFVVRTAGNVLDEIGMGSVEYGTEHLHIPLVIVLGHENCGAVKATVDGGEIHGCIKSITDKIGVSLKKLGSPADPYTACEDENIRTTVEEIKKNHVVSELLHQDKTEVVGAKYGIKSGAVTFF
jgi:carbonic anhydrase